MDHIYSYVFACIDAHVATENMCEDCACRQHSSTLRVTHALPSKLGCVAVALTNCNTTHQLSEKQIRFIKQASGIGKWHIKLMSSHELRMYVRTCTVRRTHGEREKGTHIDNRRTMTLNQLGHHRDVSASAWHLTWRECVRFKLSSKIVCLLAKVFVSDSANRRQLLFFKTRFARTYSTPIFCAYEWPRAAAGVWLTSETRDLFI